MVRRLLTDNGIDPAQVRGTGLGGRITREDVLDYIDTQRANGRAATTAAPVQPTAPQAPVQPTAPPPPAMAPPPPPPAMVPPPPAQAAAPSAPPAVSPVPSQAPRAITPAAGDSVIPFSNVRRRTAEHMVRSKATSPHAFIANETDFENVERVRRSHGPRFKAEEGFSLTYLPFVARSAVEALREYPNLNASVAGDSLVVHSEINLGIAVDLDFEGLIVPVIHRAEEVTLRGIARRIRDLADRARTRKLTADDIAGGTFSITNDGPFGTYFTVPIINQPQVAILATDGVKRRPVVVTTQDGSESIAIHSVGVLGMSWDHRAVDGAYISSYLRRVGELLSTRDWAAEL
jgi:2-oxoglutarate dehydrogenase E2 component (dihydrolipoamide succinyltransferase)